MSPVFQIALLSLLPPFSDMIAVSTPSMRNTPSFKLKSHVITPSNSSFECLYLEPYHIYRAFNYAVLTSKTSQNPGIIGHLNGTATQIETEEADLLFEGPEFPYGFVIDQINATYNPVEINAGNGTQGIFIEQGVIKYHNPMRGEFYGA